MTGQTRLSDTRQLSDQLAEDWVLSGKFKSGEKLPSERQLAEDLGVSRPMVREALRRLVERRLIEVSPGRGAYVREVSVSDAERPMSTLFVRQQATARHLLSARTMLEGQAAELAAERITIEDLASVHTAMVACESADNLIDKVRADLAFHLRVVRAAGNPVISTMFASISGLAAQMMLRSLSDPKVSREGLPFHKDIYEALRRGEPSKARRAAIGHMAVAERSYGKDLDRSLDTVARREMTRLLGPNFSVEDLLAEIG
jgi:GntR family transcriptional regulator, transcriptional repressor for pyruvate dehydrogenase complex